MPVAVYGAAAELRLLDSVDGQPGFTPGLILAAQAMLPQTPRTMNVRRRLVVFLSSTYKEEILLP